MSQRFISNRSPGLPAPIDGQDIHESWCTCSDCSFARRRTIRADLGDIALGIACAMLAVAGIWLFAVPS